MVGSRRIPAVPRANAPQRARRPAPGPRAVVPALLVAAALVGVSAGAYAGVTHSGVAPVASSATLRFRATGFFRTAFADGRWWLVTPAGRPFYSAGVDHVTSDPDVDRKTGRCPYCDAIAVKYPSLEAWQTATLDRLRKWGFNTLGPWSDNSTLGKHMPYTVLLSMASGNDWFAPSFVTNAQRVAKTQVAPLSDDPNLIGWYTDSELHWGPDWTNQQSLLDTYLTLPAGSPGRAAAEQDANNPGAFELALATRYFSVTTAAIRSVDPNHLILGVKAIAQLTPPQVVEAAAHYINVFSVDDYTLIPGLARNVQKHWGPFVPVDASLSQFHALSGLPIIIAEYSFRAAGGADPNTWPPIFPVYANQAQRAQAASSFIAPLYKAPWIVGDDWFEYVDEPAGGRFDGENSDFGLVSTGDAPWATLVSTLAALHAQAPDHAVTDRAGCGSWTRDPSTGALACNWTSPECKQIAGSDANARTWPWCGVANGTGTIALRESAARRSPGAPRARHVGRRRVSPPGSGRAG